MFSIQSLYKGDEVKQLEAYQVLSYVRTDPHFQRLIKILIDDLNRIDQVNRTCDDELEFRRNQGIAQYLDKLLEAISQSSQVASNIRDNMSQP